MDSKDWLRQAKEEAICEYCDSGALLAELGGSFAEGFDDTLRQFKAPYPDLDVSHVNIDAQAQTSVQFVHSESTNDLLAYDNPCGDKESAQIKIVEDGARQSDVVVAEEKIESTPPQQQFFFLAKL